MEGKMVVSWESTAGSWHLENFVIGMGIDLITTARDLKLLSHPCSVGKYNKSGEPTGKMAKEVAKKVPGN